MPQSSSKVTLKRSSLEKMVNFILEQSTALNKVEARIPSHEAASESDAAKQHARLHRLKADIQAGKADDEAIGKDLTKVVFHLYERVRDLEECLASCDRPTTLCEEHELSFYTVDDTYTMESYVAGCDLMDWARTKAGKKEMTAEVQVQIWKCLPADMQRLIRRPSDKFALEKCWAEAVQSDRFMAAHASCLRRLQRDGVGIVKGEDLRANYARPCPERAH